MIIEHTFTKRCQDLTSIFDKVYTMRKLINSIERSASVQNPARQPIDKYKGDCFELFIEIFLKLHPYNQFLKISDYHPNLGVDVGIDGFCINTNLEPSIVQIKYRTNTQEYLETNKDHLANFVAQGATHFQILPSDENIRHYIFTTAAGLNFYTNDEVFLNKVRCIGYEQLCKVVDNHKPFWNEVRRIVELNKV